MRMLEKQGVLVTGCSSGIGRALVEELRRLGHRPVASARRRESVEELERAGFDAVQLDVDDRASVERAVEEAGSKCDGIDVLINNAGFNHFGPLMEMPINAFERLFRTNVVGLMSVTQVVLAHMAPRRSGRVINVGSVVGVTPTPFAGAYCASKSAVHTLTEVLRQELTPLGIDVVEVQPGAVRSAIADNGAESVERYKDPHSHYYAVREDIEQRAYLSQDNPMDTHEFARRTLAQALALPAPRLVREGKGAHLVPLLGQLPGPLKDRVFERRFGLGKLRRR